MKHERTPETHRLCLPPGTQVEGWRIEGCRGHGAYGIVYRAVRVEQENAGPVALKLALYPWDPRFMREVALLSLIRHPSVPRLLSHGFWKHPAGTTHPFLIMEWVEGTPLYDWAREHHPTPRQVHQVLAQLAGALQATHAASAVHRDVKGENVLIRRSDGRAMLLDYGAGNYQSAARLTWQSEPPGTPAYRSPEAGLFIIRSVRSPNAHYRARPADDVFALGVTAYRLVTGEYPPPAEPQMDEQGAWFMEDSHPPAPQKLNPHVDSRLGGLILQMLSVAPEARGTAAELVAALGAPAEQVPPTSAVLAGVRTISRQVRPWGRILARMSGGVLALAGMLLLVWAWRGGHIQFRLEGGRTLVASVGDSAPSVPLASVHVPSEQKAIQQEPPPRPFPGQTRPNERGQCPGQEQVLINGGCWVALTMGAEQCDQNGYVFLKGKCYSPAFDQRRRKPQPTSDPADAP